jgi:hypothetical protein
MPVILATWRQRSGGSRFKASLGKKFMRPYLKKTHHKKRAGGVALEHLTSKHEALREPPKKKKRKEKKI